MNVIETKLSGCLIIEPTIYRDDRGFFLEEWHRDKYSEIGIASEFVQDNRSRSSKNILRGLHFQINKPQGKLVSVTRGCVYDVAVDLRVDSATFGQYVGVVLTGDKNNQLYIPPGFAHGFCVLSEYADFHYKCTDFYDPKDESGIIWNDNEIAIDWPIDSPILSPKDNLLPTFADYKKLPK